jgi:hypothetical protein
MERDNPAPRRDNLQRLGLIIGFVGPAAGAFTLMSGSVLIFLPLTIGSCAVAGLLFSVRHEGREGAFIALQLPIIWGFLFPAATFAGMASGAASASDFLASIALGAGAALFVGACTEAGYLGGRFVARLIRVRRVASS